MTRRVLIVEDEEHLAEGIAENLELEGYDVEVALDGERGLDRILNGGFDLVVLDLMLPKLDGFAICRQVREAGDTTPILILTVRGDLEHRLRGLEQGADDYLSKPFHLRELLLRVRAILKRGRLPESLIRFGGNEVDFRAYQAMTWDERRVDLSDKETRILRCLAARVGEVVTREQILDEVWGHEVFPSSRTIDNYIVRLRRVFEETPERPTHFHTVRGVGYRLTLEPTRETEDGVAS
ncbi:MAG: response regulator transcription factor [Acidobacteriota bacterium]